LLVILEQYGAISIVEASKELGMEQKSTAEYFKKLLKAGVLVDVGFGEHKYALSISASKRD
jgi:DNA-binding Lrp family transcriptional regulator